MARDNLKNEEVHPTRFRTEKVDGVQRIIPDEPHIGSTDTSHTPTRTEQGEYSVRGGTTRPPEGETGEPAVVDGDGNVVEDLSPAEYAKELREKQQEGAS